MKKLNIRFIVSAAVLAALALLTSCTHAPFAEKYEPGSGEVALWNNEIVTVDSQWRYIGTQSATVRGKVRDVNLWPTDQVQTMLFVRGDRTSPSVLALSRVVKGAGLDTFVYLGSPKTEVNGREYREGLYSLSSKTQDPEYSRYFEALRATGQSPAPNYRVRVLDRLPTDRVLVRIMELTPGEGTLELPPFAELYPQDREEPFPRHFF